jgi:hypothetical protein
MKRQVKKLLLNRETLRLLESANLARVAGGGVPSYVPTCDTDAANCNSQAAYCTVTQLCSGCEPCL